MYQSGIVSGHAKAGIFIEADVSHASKAQIQQACVASLDKLNDLQQQFPEAELGMTIGFGDQLWKSFNHPDEGTELKPFHPLGGGLAPATQHDIMIHVQALRYDVCFALSAAVIAAFGDTIHIADETHGHRLLQDRGMDGFVDGTENPKDDDVINVGIIPADRPDAGGTYLMIQKYLHNLHTWDKAGITQQENSVGRSKQDNIEFEKEDRLPDSHLGRVNLKKDGKTLEIVRRSLPFGTISGEHGLLFCAYCNTLYNIETQLLHMFGEFDGKTDLLLTHLSKAVSGAYYFAPSVERLRQL